MMDYKGTIKENEVKEKHPWGEFLRVRADCIDWLTLRGETDTKIAKTLSMDGPKQVRLIRERNRNLDRF